MKLIVVFLLINFAIALFLNSKRWHLANIAHEVLTAFLFAVLVFSVEDSIVSAHLQNIIGDMYYEAMHSALVSQTATEFITPFWIIQVVTFLLTVLAFIIGVNAVGNLFRGEGAQTEKVYNNVAVSCKEHTSTVTISKIFKMDCVMRC